METSASRLSLAQITALTLAAHWMENVRLAAKDFCLMNLKTFVKLVLKTVSNAHPSPLATRAKMASSS